MADDAATKGPLMTIWDNFKKNVQSVVSNVSMTRTNMIGQRTNTLGSVFQGQSGGVMSRFTGGSKAAGKTGVLGFGFLPIMKPSQEEEEKKEDGGQQESTSAETTLMTMDQLAALNA